MDEQRGSRKSLRILKVSIYAVHSYRENSPLSLVVCVVCIANNDDIPLHLPLTCSLLSSECIDDTLNIHGISRVLRLSRLRH